MDITSSRRGVGGVLVDEIESSLRKFVRVEDIQETYASQSDDNSDDAEESEELEPFGPELGVGSMEKDVTDPRTEEDDPEAALQLLFSEGSTQPIVPIVSAMKGTREKLGASPRKLTVNWAPDVYDPVPNSLSHAVKSKQKKSRKDKDKDNNNYKKNGKKGQKGYSKGGAGSKDKKQHRKTGGRSEKCYRSCDGLDSSDEFDVGSPDYCGSSFLKKSPANFHYSVAEAL
ncbi:uncharacterized protein [Euphorbia lathyris]|uniref:uncharacterized protein n=1 Tax=Euphorbia lathyris TaxID=212925 RepID=UPI0033133389